MAEPVAYIERTRLYYEAQGFDVAYQYAEHASTPFTKLAKPLDQSRIGLITTASGYFRDEMEPRKVAFGASRELPEQMYADDLSWDKKATHLNDVNSFCPIETLHDLVSDNIIGSLSERFICAPTEYSRRATEIHDAPDILAALQADEVDIALLVPL